MTFKYRYRKQILISLLILVFFGIGLFYYLNFAEKKNKEDNISLNKDITKFKKNVKQKEKQVPETIMVDVKGEVINPGIYELKKEDRVIDAINKAGGITNNGDTSVLNLSKKLKDEMVIIVYSYYQVTNFSYVKQVEQKEISSCKEGINEIENDACYEDESQNNNYINGKISINSATKEELMKLPGVGESKAENIIKYREEKGPFEQIEDIKNVNGIGDSLFAKIKENITT